ncbi:branched-chain amino acid aminotransferase [uncultured Enterovirga sp.]|uniref:branched-chain amino acid aminotransferase n=1 Tax=uncultured Enterovirga sp. TaxID=2026352 RepID=UPI0035CACAD1
MAAHSETWTFVDGLWIDGNPGLTGPRSHSFWQASSVFDGARHFEGVMPDMALHAARVNRSARAIGLDPTMEAGEIVELTREGARKFGPDAQLYVRPMYWAEGDGPSAIMPDPNSTRFCLCLYAAPLPPPTAGISVTLSKYRRPSLETAPTDAKAGCLYPNSARALRDARARGFDNALMLDMVGNVAETASSNVFMVRDGVVMTPIPNGTFLNGITRQRMIGLLRESGQEVVEASLTFEDVHGADEVFISGNYPKTMPVVRIEDRDLQPGPVGRKARELYWAFAHDGVA